MTNIETVDDSSFEADVLKSSGTVVVDFFATWCGPCKQLAPVLDEIAGETKDLKVLKLDIDMAPATARSYGIMSVPTIIVFQDGQPVKQFMGTKGKSGILSELADYMP